MKRILILAALTSAFTMPLQAASSAITLIENGKSSYVIAAPANQPVAKRHVDLAASTLQQYLKEATGAELPIVSEGEVGGKKAIYLGNTDKANKVGVAIASCKDWNCLLQEREGNLYLGGVDRDNVIKKDQDNHFYPTLKAVTRFLENNVGVRFLMPGPNGIHVPKVDKVTFESGLNDKFVPNFQYVIGRNAGDILYATANNYFYTQNIKSYGGHSHHNAVPAEKYFKTNPEYFALTKGKRILNDSHREQPRPSHSSLCISNPDVQRLMIEEMERQLQPETGHQGVQLAQTDGYKLCECDGCKAIHPDPGEGLWILHAKLAAEMYKKFPDKKIIILSYGPTRSVPKTVKSFTPNVVIEMAKYAPENFDAWNKFPNEKVAYIYNWEKFYPLGLAPKRTPKYGADLINLFVKNKVRAIYLCGAFDLIGLEGPCYYLFGRAMGDPELNAEEVEENYYKTAFGEAAPEMKHFFNKMHYLLEHYSIFHHRTFRMERDYNWSEVFGTPEISYSYFYPPDLLVEMQNAIDAAIPKVTETRAKARVNKVRQEFEHLKLTAEVFHLFRAYRVRQDQTTFELVAGGVERLRKWLDTQYDDKGEPIPFDDWPKYIGGRMKKENITVLRGKSTLRDPFNWDLAEIRKTGVYPKPPKFPPIKQARFDDD
jgi:hypothetical protein